MKKPIAISRRTIGWPAEKLIHGLQARRPGSMLCARELHSFPN